MLLGPTFPVELITTSRRTRYFVVRGIYAMILLSALWITFFEATRLNNISSLHGSANVAATYFTIFAYLQILAVLCAGPALVAGTIAEERQRRTIEYLFASELTNSEIVLGKLAARLLQVISMLLVGLPILAIAMIFGGIDPDALLRVFATTLSTVVAVSAMSIVVSISARGTREALTRVYLLVFALVGIPLLIWTVSFAIPFPLANTPYIGGIIDSILFSLACSNPVLGLTATLELWTPGGNIPLNPWETVWVLTRNQGLFAILCIAWSVWYVRRAHLRNAGAAAVERKPLFRRRVRRALVGNALVWKEVFVADSGLRLGFLGRLAMALIVLFVVGSALWMFVLELSTPPSMLWGAGLYVQFLIVVSTVVACGGLIFIAARAATSITGERERQTWDVLLSTPLGGRHILWAKLLGNLYAARGVLLLLAMLWSLEAMVRPAFLVPILFLFAVFTILNCYATALGLLCSLIAKNSLRAIGATFGVSLFLGGGYLFCCIPAFATGPGPGSEIIVSGCIPFLLAAPIIFFFEWSVGTVFNDSLFAVCTVGTIGYAALAAILWGTCLASFDSVCGRAFRDWASMTYAGRHRPITSDAEPVRSIG